MFRAGKNMPKAFEANPVRRTIVVSSDHFRYELIGQLRRAAADGAKTLVISSGELCRSIRNANHFSQACCEAMQAEVKPGDTVLQQSSGSGMTVRYLLPRG
jgi:hypothetical protein